MKTPLFIGNPSMSSIPPVWQSAMQKAQIESPSPNASDTIAPMIDDLCTQLESLTINEREEVINCLCITQGESYSQLVWSAWRRKNDAEGIYLSI